MSVGKQILDDLFTESRLGQQSLLFNRFAAVLTMLRSGKSGKSFTSASRKPCRSRAADALAPTIMPICWLKKKMLIAVARWLFSTAADNPMNWDELSKPTPKLAGRISSDSHTLIRPRHLNMIRMKLAMLRLAAAIERVLYLLVLYPARIRCLRPSCLIQAQRHAKDDIPADNLPSY